MIQKVLNDWSGTANISEYIVVDDSDTAEQDERLKKVLEMSAFRISVGWPIYIINSIDKTKFLYTTSPPMQHHSFFRNYSLHKKKVLTWLRDKGLTLSGENVRFMCQSLDLFPTLVRVLLCSCVGPIPLVGLTLTWSKLALYITH